MGCIVRALWGGLVCAFGPFIQAHSRVDGHWLAEGTGGQSSVLDPATLSHTATGTISIEGIGCHVHNV